VTLERILPRSGFFRGVAPSGELEQLVKSDPALDIAGEFLRRKRSLAE
jgi:hypothetical protein